MVRQTIKIITFGLIVFVSTTLFSQTSTDTIEDHLYKLYKSADNKAVIDYAIKIQADHPKIAKEIGVDYYIVRSAIAVDDAVLADKYADKVLNLSSKDGDNELIKSDACLKMANYYHDKYKPDKEVYWLKLRLYKWTTEKCGVGKKQRNIEYYERIVSCYDKLGDTHNKTKFQKKLDDYKTSTADAWITP